ncbi:hypothetical protein Pcinc_012406 [Petrolisthes cinctipes]|uniref:Uncharacterized protein n=1 Tax=Petrolisthes cinctipes TaxID=88211 RepID=A0AAE1G1V9_PETCI|nr:hypothetical protein Pcinc_012406 [Petrolisthes cinctipes]
MSDISSGMEPSSPPPVIKKRQNPENWIQNKAKKKRNSGQAYQSRTGKEVAGRSIGPPCTCGCFDRIPVDVRQAIHKIFYEMGDWVLQNSYLQKHIKSQPVKRRRKPKDANNPGPHRSCTLTYTLSHAATTYSVCKKAFLSILALGRTRIVSALNSMTATGKSTPDMRGQHKPPNAVPIESARLASDHIDSFPTVMSHYSRAKSPKLKYLDPSLSVNTMHHLYSSWLVENHPGKKAVSLDYYRRIFRGKDLSFSPPNSDTCTTCDKAKNGIHLANETNNEQGKVALQESLDAHITQARIGQALMKQYGNIKEPDTRVIAIDLQQTQPLPRLTTSAQPSQCILDLIFVQSAHDVHWLTETMPRFQRSQESR